MTFENILELSKNVICQKYFINFIKNPKKPVSLSN